MGLGSTAGKSQIESVREKEKKWNSSLSIRQQLCMEERELEGMVQCMEIET